MGFVKEDEKGGRLENEGRKTECRWNDGWNKEDGRREETRMREEMKEKRKEKGNENEPERLISPKNHITHPVVPAPDPEHASRKSSPPHSNPMCVSSTRLLSLYSHSITTSPSRCSGDPNPLVPLCSCICEVTPITKLPRLSG